MVALTDPSRRLSPAALGWGLTLVALSNPVVSLLRVKHELKWGANVHTFVLAAALLAAGAFWLPKLWHSRRSVAAAFVELPALAPLCLWALLSTVWSVAARRTAVQASMLCVGTILAVLAGRCLDDRGRRRALMVVLAVVLLLTVGFVWLLPQYGLTHNAVHPGAWRGPYPHKNGLGLVVGAGMLAAVFEVHDKSGWRRMAALLVGIGCVVLWMSNSMSAMLSLGAAAAVYLAMRLYGRVPRRLRRALLLSSPILAVTAVGLASRPEALAMIGRDATLTNRTTIWRAVIERIAERPVIGYGYLAYWDGAPDARDITAATISRGQYGWGRGGHQAPAFIVSTAPAPADAEPWRVTNAHNSYLDVALDLGMVGVLLLLAHLALAITRLWRRFTPDGRDAGIAFFAYILILGMVEPVLLHGWYSFGLLWLTGVMYSTLPAPESTAS